jgi:hypothetical protein
VLHLTAIPRADLLPARVDPDGHLNRVRASVVATRGGEMDIGAFVGWHSSSPSRRPGKELHAFEPDELRFLSTGERYARWIYRRL